MQRAIQAAVHLVPTAETHTSEKSAALRAKLTGVKPFPAVVARVQAVASDPRRTVADVADVVERDIAFASRMLRVVNSAAFGLAARCTTVRHAVALLGTRRVASIATSTAALEMVEQTLGAAPAIVKHAVACGGVARFLASYAGVSPDEAFTVGLLHDVGMLLVLQAGDSFYEELVDQMGDGEPSSEEEVALLGFDHAQLGAEALRSWGLPSPLPEVVELHHDWNGASALGGSTTNLIALLRVADLLVPRATARLTPEEADLEALRDEPAVAHVGFSPEELVRMWPQIRAAAAESPYGEGEGRASLPEPRARVSLTSVDAAIGPAANDTTAPPDRPAWIVPVAAVTAVGVLAAIGAALLR